MKVELFQLEFDDASVNPQAVYHAGQAVSLRVHLVLRDSIKCRSVDVMIYGSSIVCFAKGSGRPRAYMTEEAYINEQISLFVPETMGPYAGYHPPGEYFYPVSFTLPRTAPSSFEDSHGKIRYYITGNINRPWKLDKGIKTHFTVIHDLDLNNRPVSLIDAFNTDESDPAQLYMNADCLCSLCNCFSCGRIEVRMRLAKRGYVPGETIHVLGEVFNGACVNLQGVRLLLLQKAEFSAEGRQKRSIREAAAICLPGIPPSQSLLLNHELPVPPVVCSYLGGCNSIEVTYVLRIVAQNQCCDIAKLDCCDIIIGTVPLRPPQGQSQAGGTMANDSAPTAWQFPDAEMPLPSYGECVFGRVRVQSDQGNDQSQCNCSQEHWAPSYPVYAV